MPYRDGNGLFAFFIGGILILSMQKARFTGELFCRKHALPAAGRAAKRVRKALLRKATEPDVHAAGFAIKIEGLRPSDTTRFFRQDESSPGGELRLLKKN